LTKLINLHQFVSKDNQVLNKADLVVKEAVFLIVLCCNCEAEWAGFTMKFSPASLRYCFIVGAGIGYFTFSFRQRRLQ
jgi:multisubunit Na+/H+ antiporter MnhE subunit